ncbi:hypothetical protein DFH28DRAFT_947401 [Melampsora americana]|nr:hypothetical protein DFH28DRAFT_947401 [Melampsora americana]
MHFILLLPIISNIFFVMGETKMIGHVQDRWFAHKSRSILQRRMISSSRKISKKDKVCNETQKQINRSHIGNMAVCKALGGGTMLGDLRDCQAVTHFMATRGVPCAMFRSCAVMTRDSDDKPTALVKASPDEAMSCIGNHLSKYCKVQNPIQLKKVSSLNSPNDHQLNFTFLFFNILEINPNPQVCDSEIFEALKDSPSS